MKAAVLLIAAAALTGCSVIQPPKPPVVEAAPLPAAALAPAAQTRGGGLFQAGRVSSLTADTRAFRPGDVLTVTLAETTQASKSAGTQLGKKSDGIYKLGLGIKAGGSTSMDRSFDGNASSSQQNQLQGAITVVVQEVLPNGLLRVQGEKSLWINQGEELIRLAGYVRAADVDNANRVPSERVANARISYSGQGDLADANTPGWLTRMFNSPWNPF